MAYRRRVAFFSSLGHCTGFAFCNNRKHGAGLPFLIPGIRHHPEVYPTSPLHLLILWPTMSVKHALPVVVCRAFMKSTPFSPCFSFFSPAPFLHLLFSFSPSFLLIISPPSPFFFSFAFSSPPPFFILFLYLLFFTVTWIWICTDPHYGRPLGCGSWPRRQKSPKICNKSAENLILTIWIPKKN